MTQTTILYGPQGCGKTRNAESIAAALGLERIRDEWTEGDPVPGPSGWLLIGTIKPNPHLLRRLGVRAMSFQEAIGRVGRASGRV